MELQLTDETSLDLIGNISTDDNNLPELLIALQSTTNGRTEHKFCKMQ